MKSLLLAFGAGAAVAALAFAVVLSAQQQGTPDLEAMRKDIEALKVRQQNIERQLSQLLAALNQQREPQQVAINIANAPSKGRADAKVTMVEFSDFQCPFCGRHFRETMPQIDREYIQTGKVRYIFRDFPIDSLHPQAQKLHEAANCANAQGKYWEMWERIFANPKAAAPADLETHARTIGLDTSKFRQCLDSGEYADEVRASVQEAISLGASGTPIIFFGVTEPGSKTVKAIRVLRGAYPYDRFKATIDSLLAQ